MLMTCSGCAAEFHARADAKFCSAACRQRAARLRARRKGLWADATVARQVEWINTVNNTSFQPAVIARYLPEVKVLWIRSLTDTIRFMTESLAKVDGLKPDGSPLTASATSGGRPGATSYSTAIQATSAAITDNCESLTDEQVLEALGAAQYQYELLRGEKIIRERQNSQNVL